MQGTYTKVLLFRFGEVIKETTKTPNPEEKSDT